VKDRITNIWGERTPHGAETDWPIRVDSQLDVPAEDVESWHTSACVLCSNGCGLEIAVKDGRIVGVRGRVEDRVNHGRLGPKGLFGWQANNSPDRLTRPLIRRNGSLEQTDWNTAMSAIVDRSKALLGDTGPGAFGFYTTGQLFTEDYYSQCLVARVGIGTNHLDGNTRLCTATSDAALKETFGTDGNPGSYEDVDLCDTLSSSDTTWPRRKPCSGRGCSTGCTDPTGPSSSASTRGRRSQPGRPTCTWPYEAARTSPS
jgi:ferredoxin-nitrate reductase